MNDPVQEPPAKNRSIAALRGLFVFAAWLLFFLIPLSLGTLLPPISSRLNLSGCLIVSILLTMLFRAWLPVRAGAEAKNGAFKAALALLALAAVCYAAVSAVSAHWFRETEVARLGVQKSGFQVSLAGFQENIPGGRYLYPKLSKTIETGFKPVLDGKAADKDAAHVYGGVEAWNKETAKKENAYSAAFAPYLEKELAPLLKQKFDGYMKVDYALAARDPLGPSARQLGNLSTMVKIAEAAKLRAVSLAINGDTGKAWDTVRLQFALADILVKEKSLVGKLVTLAVRGQGVDAAAGILLNRPGAILPEDIAVKLREASSGGLAAEGIMAELAYQYDIFDLLRRMSFAEFREMGGLSSLAISASAPSSNIRGEYVFFSLLRKIGIFDLNSLATVGYFTAIVRPGPWAQVSAQNARAESRVEGLPFWPFFMAKISLPSFGKLFARELDIQARARLALVSARLRGWRQAHGKYPGKLSELKLKEEGTDVYSGGELVYEPAAGGKGFDLCSAGSAGDRKDVSGRDLCMRQR